MSSRQLVLLRLVLAVMAVSLVVVGTRKALLAARYLSPLVELAGTVEKADLIDPIPMAEGNPRARDIIMPVPTHLQTVLREYPGLRFEVALREEPKLIPPPLTPGDSIQLVLPSRWREVVVGDRVLAMGLKRGTETLVDPAGYPYAAEYRTAFLSVGMIVAALIAAIGAWRIRSTPRST